MSNYLILPYTEIDGIRTVPDSEIKRLFERTEGDGLVPIVFYEGTVQAPDQFLAMAKASGTLFYILMVGKDVVGYTWLNRLENRTTRLHFCVFKDHWGMAVPLGQHVLKTIINMQTEEGEYIFDLLTGFIPAWNERAINYALVCGWETHGTIPNAIYNQAAGKSEPAVFFYYRRSEDD